jgi:hypothetical protein
LAVTPHGLGSVDDSDFFATAARAKNFKHGDVYINGLPRRGVRRQMDQVEAGTIGGDYQVDYQDWEGMEGDGIGGLID